MELKEMDVLTISDFQKKYGAKGFAFRHVLEEFIYRSPDFPGAMDMAKALGEMMADLESALQDHHNKLNDPNYRR
jgi:hypothetical protein